ncbi:MAG: sigma-70 family RNA polymerase sigma factor [Lachnospiraceae bacterium]|nr:sigma-70 family RNA polymerase sigma factor [Lachnospiraceae bacterium]
MLDEEIIELFFERSEQALKELEAKYGKLCVQTSYNILGNFSDAEECVNDSYLGVWNAIPPTRPNPLLTFVLKIVRNLSLNRYHKNKALKRNSSYDLAIEELADFVAAPESIESIIETNELTKTIEDFLDTLNEQNRVIFMRRYWFFDDYGLIAKRVGLSEKNVSVKLTRIRKQLKVYLEERGTYI